MDDWVSIGYLLSAALFIFGLKKLLSLSKNVLRNTLDFMLF